jgi:AcrR family transcriptional regulator
MSEAPATIEIGTDRPLRADARRNREAVLKAARKVFAEKGTDAQMDDIARKAKVGVGTVYRHFPTKDALLEELVRETFRQMASWLEEALKAEDSWSAFVDVMWRGAELHAKDRGFTEVVADAKRRIADEAAYEAGVTAGMGELLTRAQAAGQLRPDVRPEDLQPLFCSLGAVMHGFEDPACWRRHLTLMLDALRADAAVSPLRP